MLTGTAGANTHRRPGRRRPDPGPRPATTRCAATTAATCSTAAPATTCSTAATASTSPATAAAPRSTVDLARHGTGQARQRDRHADRHRGGDRLQRRRHASRATTGANWFQGGAARTSPPAAPGATSTTSTGPGQPAGRANRDVITDFAPADRQDRPDRASTPTSRSPGNQAFRWVGTDRADRRRAGRLLHLGRQHHRPRQHRRRHAARVRDPAQRPHRDWGGTCSTCNAGPPLRRDGLVLRPHGIEQTVTSPAIGPLIAAWKLGFCRRMPASRVEPERGRPEMKCSFGSASLVNSDRLDVRDLWACVASRTPARTALCFGRTVDDPATELKSCFCSRPSLLRGPADNALGGRWAVPGSCNRRSIPVPDAFLHLSATDLTLWHSGVRRVSDPCWNISP